MRLRLRRYKKGWQPAPATERRPRCSRATVQEQTSVVVSPKPLTLDRKSRLLKKLMVEQPWLRDPEAAGWVAAHAELWLEPTDNVLRHARSFNEEFQRVDL